MKKLKKQNHTKVALFAGAAALMALTPNTHAQSSVDALLNKLEQKGILTVDEAKELKTENQQDSAADLNKAMNSRFPMPDWVTSYKLYGDFRGRFDELTTDSPGAAALSAQDRMRLRYRLRVGMLVNMKDDLQVGFRLGSGDATGVGSQSSAGSPLSNNSTLQDIGTKKMIYIDAAYGKWTPINDGVWMLAATIGKMDQPFQVSQMVFDSDYTPEGGALQGSYKINDNHSLAVNGAAFVLDEMAASARDPFMYGAQAIWNANWTPHIGSSLGIGAFDIVNKQALGLSGGAKTLAAGTTTISGNLALSGSATATTVVALTVSGTLNVGDGTTLTAAGFHYLIQHVIDAVSDPDGVEQYRNTGTFHVIVISGTHVAILAALVPLWLAVFSMAKEPLGPKGWTGLILGIAGVAVLVWPHGSMRIHGGGLAAMVAAPLIWAWGTLHGKHHVHGGSLLTNVGIQMLTAALIGLAVAPFTGGFLRGPVTPKAIGAIAYLAAFGSLLAFSAYIYLAKAWPPAKMGTYAYLNPLVAVLLGSLILHEAFGPREILGMAIILAAVALVQLREKSVSKT